MQSKFYRQLGRGGARGGEKEVKSNARYNIKVKGKPSGSRYVDLWTKVYNGPRGEPWMTTMDLVR